MPRLEEWTLVDAYGMPAAIIEINRGQALHGRVYGHSRQPDGKSVRTSSIVAVTARRVTTSSGQVYELGEPHGEYQAWLGARPLPVAPMPQLAPTDVSDVAVTS